MLDGFDVVLAIIDPADRPEKLPHIPGAVDVGEQPLSRSGIIGDRVGTRSDHAAHDLEQRLARDTELGEASINFRMIGKHANRSHRIAPR